jgi:hypothetical protein
MLIHIKIIPAVIEKAKRKNIILGYKPYKTYKEMKKVLFIAAVGVISLASCKKDYTCACKDGSTTVATYTVHTTKKKSKDLCSENDASVKVVYPSASCTIQ